jgi:hypothetical protein
MLEYPALFDGEALAHLGSIIIWWSRVEQLMFDDMAARRKRPHLQSQPTFARIEMNANGLIRQWAAAVLVELQDSADQKGIEELRTDLYAFAERRNELIHAFWDYPEVASRTEHKLTHIRSSADNLSYLIRQGTVSTNALAELNREATRLYHMVLPLTL